MIKVNIKNLTASRAVILPALQGLSNETLNNLQTAVNPVPEEFKDIEFWDEVDATPPYDSTTHTLDGTETLTSNAETKTVSVVRGVRAKTQEELDAERKARVPQTITKLKAMKQMKVIGKWEAFKTVLAGDDDINDEWVISDNLNRTYPLVLGIGQLFGFTDADMDNFFIEASKL